MGCENDPRFANGDFAQNGISTSRMNKKSLTEADIRTKFITSALVRPNGAKWNVMTQNCEEANFTKGHVIVRGKTVKRGEEIKGDFIVSYLPNLPIAVLDPVLQKYAKCGISSVKSLEILQVDPLTGQCTPVEIVKLFLGRKGYSAAIRELETAL